MLYDSGPAETHTAPPTALPSGGRISHLKRGYALRRSRQKGDEGQRTWTGGAFSPITLTRLPSGPADPTVTTHCTGSLCQSTTHDKRLRRHHTDAAVFTPKTFPQELAHDEARRHLQDCGTHVRAVEG